MERACNWTKLYKTIVSGLWKSTNMKKRSGICSRVDKQCSQSAWGEEPQSRPEPTLPWPQELSPCREREHGDATDRSAGLWSWSHLEQQPASQKPDELNEGILATREALKG